MRRKGFAIAAAAAVLTFGMMINAYAAEGWARSESNTWIYLDRNGNRVRNEWKRGADNLWRWLDSNGEMAVSSWVDGDDYYVDSNGIMLSEQWLQTEDPYGRDGELYWYYFKSSGKKAVDEWETVKGYQYLFDTEGRMQTEWSEDGMYWLGTDGARRSGWKYLAPPDEDGYDFYGEESMDGMYWYYFGSNGKKYTPENTNEGGDYRIARINGEYFCFGPDGRMMTGWVYLQGDPDSAPSDSIEDWAYYAEEGIRNVTLGAAVQGWLSLEPPEILQNNIDEPVVWYYFNKDGTPKTGPGYEDASTSDFTRIDGKNYLFDHRGNPVDGLIQVEIGSTGEYTAYYFDEDSKTVVKGRKTIEEGDGTKSTFYFNEGTNSGRGVTGVKDNYLYYMGKRQEADSDSRYTLYSIPNNDGTYDTYVVNTSGRISKNRTVKDRDDNEYEVNSSGMVTSINGETVNKNESYGEPIAPVFYDWDY